MLKSELITALLRLPGDPYVVFPCNCTKETHYFDVDAVTLIEMFTIDTKQPITCAVLAQVDE